jgi:2-aminoadipate transaminase
MNYSQTTLTMKSSMIRELVAITKGVPGMISFAGGFPNPVTFPRESLSEEYRLAVDEDGADTLQYGASEGDEQLKRELLKLENEPGLTPNEILVTAGATHAIYMYTRTFVDPGDVVLSESPSFLGSLVAIEAAGAEVLGVDSDNEGIIPARLGERLEECHRLNKRVKFLYVIPEFQNPTGITTSEARRLEIIAVAREYGIGILEDNPYGQLRYFGTGIPSFRTLAREKYNDRHTVTLVKSFSKILGPGIRMGYMISDERTISHCCSWMQKTTVTVDCVSQRAVARFIAAGKLEPQITRIRDYYRPQLQAMLDALQKFMPANVSWTRPEGGMFLWMEVPEKINTDEVFVKARELKVAYLPGSKFYPSGSEHYNTMRLNFSYPTVEQIWIGVERLAGLITQAIQEVSNGQSR